ncbi:unnamed protein product [Dibothriocephalus latus]|uniref:Uncharacterized protein n=1 Tax=Dibothriocephalus latus TaxID=60516 RepID=A0A3P7NPQ9_DIBLA|nr:unnamed protein product [Dibothriocephalus latus]
MRAKGETLNSDQEKALLDYDMVSCSVTVIKEMVDGLAELQVKLDEAFEAHEKETSVRNEEFAVDSIQREPVAPKKKPAPRAPEPPVKKNTSATQPPQTKPEPVHTEPPVAKAPEHEFLNNVEADVILSTVLNPLKPSFNFLQMPRMDSEIPQGIPVIQPAMHQPQLDQPRQVETPHEHEIQPQQIEMPSKCPEKPNEVFMHPEPVTQQISSGPQQAPTQVENHQQHQEQVQPTLGNQDAAKHPEKPADSLKKPKAKRGKPAPAAEPPSKAAVVNAEQVQEEVKPPKPKTWADLVRGSAADTVSSSPSQPPAFEQISITEPVPLKTPVHEDEVTQDNHGQRPAYGRENGNWAPRGGFRGGRGRGAGPGFRGTSY